MTFFAVIRHAPTEWNAIGRVQGRTDIPLSEEGRAAASGWVAPEALAGFDWVASPLKRTMETAAILSGAEVRTDRRLIEMDWAEWEGATLTALREELGDLMAAWEARGLDFRAPAGESPRDVQMRLTALLTEIAQQGRPTVAVTHKGVIRALYALATGWDMTGKPPEKLRESCVHIFMLAPSGAPSVERLNISLCRDPA